MIGKMSENRSSMIYWFSTRRAGWLEMYYNEVNIIVIVFASLSMALCLSQIVTCIVFRRKLLSKTYIQVVFFMGISDFLGAMSMVASFKDGSILCSIQGPLIIFSQCSAILWADCAVRILYLAVIHDRQPHESNGMRFYHLCCWPSWSWWRRVGIRRKRRRWGG